MAWRHIEYVLLQRRRNVISEICIKFNNYQNYFQPHPTPDPTAARSSKPGQKQTKQKKGKKKNNLKSTQIFLSTFREAQFAKWNQTTV